MGLELDVVDETVDELSPLVLLDIDYTNEGLDVSALVITGIGDDEVVELVEIDEMLVMLVIIRGDEFDDYDYVLV